MMSGAVSKSMLVYMLSRTGTGYIFIYLFRNKPCRYSWMEATWDDLSGIPLRMSISNRCLSGFFCGGGDVKFKNSRCDSSLPSFQMQGTGRHQWKNLKNAASPSPTGGCCCWFNSILLPFVFAVFSHLHAEPKVNRYTVYFLDNDKQRCGSGCRARVWINKKRKNAF